MTQSGHKVNRLNFLQGLLDFVTIRSGNAGQAAADALREVIGTIGRAGTFIDDASLAQSLERKALVEGSALVNEFREIATQQHLPAERHAAPDGLHMGDDVGGAVGGGGVVELRLRGQLIDLRDILQKQATDLLRGRFYPIKINIFRRVAMGRAQPDQVAFFADNINQLVAAKEPGERRKGLPLFLPNLDGDRHVLAAEIETQDGMGDGVTHPINGDQVERMKLPEIDGLIPDCPDELLV